MTATLGQLCLVLAVLASAATVLAAAVGALKVMRSLMAAVAGFVLISSITLWHLLINSDFSVEYVAGYTERVLPFGYKIAAFWAGQEGSLLLWTLVLTLMNMVATFLYRKQSKTEQAAGVAALAIVGGFFAALMLFAADPFATSATVPADGHGLNPLLQDPAMIIHPPLLFIGYAGFTIPFGMLVGALVAGRRDNQWIAQTRRWLLVSWLFLSAGILLGAEWAYVELGWGGYWAWDPVENASLLPWLTGTAVLHSIGVQIQRGMFKRWNAFLIAGTFLLCIFGTYLTRSGVIQSVHAFGESVIGTFFLSFLIITLIMTAILLAWRWKLLEPDQPLEQLVSKEGAFLAANALLVLMTVVTFVGTIFPWISGWVQEEPGSVGPAFYNKAVLPLGLLLVALMSIGPLLNHRQRLNRGLIRAAVVGLLTIIVSWALGLRDVWSLVCAALTAAMLFTVVTELIYAARERARVEEQSFFTAFIKMIDGNHRRFGGQIAHLGVIMIVVGIAGSSLFTQKEAFQLKAGESAEIAGYQVVMVEMTKIREAHYLAYDAKVMLTDPNGRTTHLHPQVCFYDKSEQPHTEVAIQSTLLKDVYVTLAGWENAGGLVAIQVIINPLVVWIWIGSIVLALGSFYCVLPRLIRVAYPKKVGIALPLAGAMSCPCARS